jgi:hypothetical protein
MKSRIKKKAHSLHRLVRGAIGLKMPDMEITNASASTALNTSLAISAGLSANCATENRARQ